MRKSAILPAAVACCGMTAAVGAAGQAEVIEACRALRTDEARIACLEAALADNGTGRSVAGGESAPADESSAPASGQDHTAEEPASADAPESAQAPVQKPPHPPAELSDQPQHRTVDESIGARQVRARDGTASELESASGLRVAEYAQVPYRRLQVTLADGQVWRQIEGDTQRIRVDLRRNQTVDIKESRLGGYQLRLNELERTIRVERVR